MSDSMPLEAPVTKGVMLVDDHPIVRRGFEQLIDREPGLKVVAEAGSAAEAIQIYPVERPDIVVVDVSLPTVNGIELTKALRKIDPGAIVLVLSMHDEDIYAERAIRAGARGYIMKSELPETVIRAIRGVLAGEMHISGRIASRLIGASLGGVGGEIRRAKPRQGMDGLTDRQIEIFEMIGNGKVSREIAYLLGLSIKTVETHRAHIKRKLGLQNGRDLIQHAICWVAGEGAPSKERPAPRHLPPAAPPLDTPAADMTQGNPD